MIADKYYCTNINYKLITIKAYRQLHTRHHIRGLRCKPPSWRAPLRDCRACARPPDGATVYGSEQLLNGSIGSTTLDQCTEAVDGQTEDCVNIVAVCDIVLEDRLCVCRCEVSPLCERIPVNGLDIAGICDLQAQGKGP